jgi:hypothetical protein
MDQHIFSVYPHPSTISVESSATCLLAVEGGFEILQKFISKKQLDLKLLAS